MVKDVVKSECRMIDMWSCFQTVDALEKHSAGRKEMDRDQRGKTLRAEKEHRPPYVVKLLPRDDKHVVTTIRQPLAENAFLLPQVLYCNLESHLCQVLFSINSALKI